MSFLSIMKNFAHLLGLDWAKAQHNSLAYNMVRILCRPLVNSKKYLIAVGLGVCGGSGEYRAVALVRKQKGGEQV